MVNAACEVSVDVLCDDDDGRDSETVGDDCKWDGAGEEY